MAGMHPLAQKIKVFCFFSSEKKTFLKRRNRGIDQPQKRQHPAQNAQRGAA
jgi:hypothetical protein